MIVLSLAMTTHYYDEEIFTDDLMCFFDNFSISEIKKTFIDGVMGNCSKNFKKDVYSRLIRYKEGKDYWAEASAPELVTIWKMMRTTLEHCIYDKISIDDYAQERLEEAVAELKEGKINEQRYIERCNRINYCKERDEKMLSGCACSAIGNIDFEGDLVIVCLPCDFDLDAKVVNF